MTAQDAVKTLATKITEENIVAVLTQCSEETYREVADKYYQLKNQTLANMIIQTFKNYQPLLFMNDLLINRSQAAAFIFKEAIYGPGTDTRSLICYTVLQAETSYQDVKRHYFNVLQREGEK